MKKSKSWYSFLIVTILVMLGIIVLLSNETVDKFITKKISGVDTDSLDHAMVRELDSTIAAYEADTLRVRRDSLLLVLETRKREMQWIMDSTMFAAKQRIIDSYGEVLNDSAWVSADILAHAQAYALQKGYVITSMEFRQVNK